MLDAICDLVHTAMNRISMSCLRATECDRVLPSLGGTGNGWNDRKEVWI
jgi:hypothetical protein